MKLKTTVDVTFTVSTRWLVDQDKVEEQKKEIGDLFKEYLTNEESVFFDDYGRDAWGGYEGPNVIWVEVKPILEARAEA